jgi:hypothetical protein
MTAPAPTKRVMVVEKRRGSRAGTQDEIAAPQVAEIGWRARATLLCARAIFPQGCLDGRQNQATSRDQKASGPQFCHVPAAARARAQAPAPVARRRAACSCFSTTSPLRATCCARHASLSHILHLQLSRGVQRAAQVSRAVLPSLPP